MPYPGQFHRLVMIGSLYAEQFNMTLNIVPSALGELGMPAVGDLTLAAVADDVATWFPLAVGGGGVGIISNAKLTSITLNRLDTAGHYMDNPQEHIYPTPIAGSSGALLAPQLSIAVTLGTQLDRGRGSKGRIYLPPTSSMSTLATDGRLTQAFALAVATGFKPLIDAINGTYVGIGKVGVASNTGAGRFEHITRVSVGRVLDTMRSRRTSLAEDHQELAI
jgi:hypothetical protein